MSKLPSIIIITETWLDKYVVLPKFLSSCYSVIRKDRNKHGGDVIILIDTNIGTTEITNIYVNIEHA